GIILSNAFMVVAEVPEAGSMIWPAYEYDELLKDSKNELHKLKSLLEQKDAEGAFRPAISCLAGCGSVADVLNEIVEKNKVALTVMATHNAAGLSSWLIGDHAKRVIDGAKGPLLLVPPHFAIAPIKK